MSPVLNVEIPEELDRKLRMRIAERYGGRKGDIQKAVVSALGIWVSGDAITEAEETIKSTPDRAAKLQAGRILKLSKEKGLAPLLRLYQDEGLEPDVRELMRAEMHDLLGELERDKARKQLRSR